MDLNCFSNADLVNQALLQTRRLSADLANQGFVFEPSELIMGGLELFLQCRPRQSDFDSNMASQYRPCQSGFVFEQTQGLRIDLSVSEQTLSVKAQGRLLNCVSQLNLAN